MTIFQLGILINSHGLSSFIQLLCWYACLISLSRFACKLKWFHLFEILFIYVPPFVVNCKFFVYFDSACLTVFTLYRLDNHIMKALCRLNELGGSSKTTIASFKVKGRYRIAPTPAYSDRGRHQPMLLLEGGRKASYEIWQGWEQYPYEFWVRLKISNIPYGAVTEVEAATTEAEEATKEAAEAGCRCNGSFCKSCNENTKGEKHPKNCNSRFYLPLY